MMTIWITNQKLILGKVMASMCRIEEIGIFQEKEYSIVEDLWAVIHIISINIAVVFENNKLIKLILISIMVMYCHWEWTQADNQAVTKISILMKIRQIEIVENNNNHKRMQHHLSGIVSLRQITYHKWTVSKLNRYLIVLSQSQGLSINMMINKWNPLFLSWL